MRWTSDHTKTVALLLLFASAGVAAGLWTRSRRAVPVAAGPDTNRREPGLRETLPRGSAHAPSTPPHFLAAERGAPAIETRPGRPGYDPTRFAALLSARQMFQREPRAAHWADTMEARLRAPIERDLAAVLPGAKFDAIDCKTSVCKVSWTSAGGAADIRKVRDLMLALFSGSGVGSDDETTEVYLIYAGGPMRDVETQDPDKLLNALADLRQKRLQMIRKAHEQGRAGPFPALGANEWPRE